MKKRGRPRLKASEAKRASFNTRLRDGLKAHLESAAKRVGRSLSEEIEFRLELSFQKELSISDAMSDALGGARAARLFRVLAATAMAEGYPADWPDDYEQFNQVIDRWHRLLQGMAPIISEEMRTRIEQYRATLAKIDDATISGEHRERLLTWVRLAAEDTGLPEELRAELAAKATGGGKK